MKSKKFLVKNESIEQFFKENIDEDIKEKYVNRDAVNGTIFHGANNFKDELFLNSTQLSNNYNSLLFEYEPAVEKCEKTDKKLIYLYTYKIENYDNVKSKLILKDFEVSLN